MPELSFLITLELRVTMTEQAAMERYKVVDPYMIAAAMTEQANRDIVGRMKAENGEVQGGSAVVRPVTG